MKRAFTLVEILVVVAVLGLVFTLSIPAFKRIINKAPLEQGIGDVVSLCRLAREKAIVKQQAMDVVLNGTEEIVKVTTAARVINASDPTTGLMIKEAEETQLIDQATLQVDLEIIEPETDAFTLDEIRIRFYPDGTSETLTLRVADDDDAYLLTLDPVTGRARGVNEDDL